MYHDNKCWYKVDLYHNNKFVGIRLICIMIISVMVKVDLYHNNKCIGIRLICIMIISVLV